MNKRLIFLGVGVFMLLGLGVGLVLLFSPVTVQIQIDGQVDHITTSALTVGWVVRDAGIVLNEGDQVTPGLDERLPGGNAVILIRRAHPVSLWEAGQGLLKTWRTTERVPAKLIEAGGVTLTPADQVLWNGAPVALDVSLAPADSYVLQIRRSLWTSLQIGVNSVKISSLGATIGHALWEQKVAVTNLDRLSAPYNASLSDTPLVSIRPAQSFRIQVDGKQIVVQTGAVTVGQALASAGIALEGLDYAVPSEDQPLPPDGVARVVRVREEVELQQTALPYKSEFVADPNTELDQQSIVQVGQPGVQLARVRVRFEDGQEVSRQKEAEWVAAQPKNQKTGYGTKIVIRTLDTPDGPIQYWRAVKVYATSYAPCKFIEFIGQCSYTTAAGYPLQKGVIGVGEAWYKLMKGWNVFVDGYGPARVGDYGYIPGFQIDLGYSDADFVNWHRTTTLYFLTPAPTNVTWILPK
jgi:uncharacterized protein YabE (DUF348 family)